MRCKVVDGKGDMSEFVGGLLWDTFGSYDSISHNVDQSLLAVSNCLIELFDCVVTAVQQDVHDALRHAAASI